MVDRDLPGTGLLTNLVVLFLQAVDTHRDRDVQVGTLFQNARDVGEDSFLNLSVRHQVNRFEIIMTIKRADDFRQVFPSKWLAAGEDQHAEIPAESLRDAINLVRLHLEFLARSIVELIREEAMRATHVAH